MKIFKKIILLLLILNSNLLFSQDTLFIYDTIFVYDTVYVYDTIKIETEKSILLEQIDSLENELNSINLKNNDSLTATISKNNIIVDETIKKIEAMKNVNLLGVLLVAVQTVTLAQHDLGITGGLTMYGTTDNIKNVSNPTTPGFNIGAFYQHNFSEKVGLRVGAEYLYNVNGTEAKLSGTDSTEAVYQAFFNNKVEDVHQFNITKYHSQIAIPLTLNFSLGKISPFVGIEYRYKIYNEVAFVGFISDLGAKLGAIYTLSEKISLAVNYYQGLTNQQFNFQETKLKSHSIGLGVQYKF